MLEVKIEGLEEVMSMLEQLPTVAMEKTVLRNALKKAAEPMVEQANASVPEGIRDKPPAVRISTRAQRWQRYTKGVAFVNIIYNHPLAHLFEAGTTQRHTRKGSYRGFMTPKPFIRPAFDANKERAVEIFSKEIFVQLGKAAERLVKRAARGTLSLRQAKGLYLRSK